MTSLLHLFSLSFGFPSSFLKSPSLRWGRGCICSDKLRSAGNTPRHRHLSPNLRNCSHGHGPRVTAPAPAQCGVAQRLWNRASSPGFPVFRVWLFEVWNSLSANAGVLNILVLHILIPTNAQHLESLHSSPQQHTMPWHTRISKTSVCFISVQRF